MESGSLLSGKEDMEDAQASFVSAVRDSQGRRLPQAIAHRGYKAAYPENSMGAFKGAVEVGSHAIETDLHVTKDGVVVISHDADLKRCFGKEEKIVDCEWSYLKTLRTTREPQQAMPRLLDLLEYLTTPGLEDIWILLDIKVPLPAWGEMIRKPKHADQLKIDNQAEEIMRLIAETLAQVKPTRPWNQRVLLGCWAAKYVPICTRYLPSYHVVHIGFNIPYARQFLKVPNASFNMAQQMMAGPSGNAFLKEVQAAKRAMFFWTVNEEKWMKWSIHKQIDGVITDDPKKYLEVCAAYDGKKVRLPLQAWVTVLCFNILGAVFSVLFQRKYGSKVDVEKVKRNLVPAA